MKLVTWILLVILVAAGIYFFGFSKPPVDADRASLTGNVVANVEAVGISGEKIPVMLSKSKFEFEGFGPGKSHVGTFDEWNAQVYVRDSRLDKTFLGFDGEITVDSVNTGIGRLDDHLASDDFFDATQFPKIIFTTTGYSDGQLTGVLDFRGVKKEITFPVEVGDGKVAADFLLDATDFSFKYTAVNKDVRIAFEFYY